MIRRRHVLAALAAGVVPLAAGGGHSASAEQSGLRQTASFRFTTKKPGAPSGVRVSLRFMNPDDPAVKPYAVQRMVFHWPGKHLGDTTVPARCTASDAEILAQGPDACPPKSKVGGGKAVTDTGAGDDRYQDVTVSAFNEEGGLIGVTVTDSTPLIRTVDHTKFDTKTRTKSTDVTPFPGFPPPEPYTPVKSLDLFYPKLVRHGRAYGMTPPRCPRAGYWTFKADFTYHDGVTQTVESRSPCRRRVAAAQAASKR
jgi:hypothetical protein